MGEAVAPASALCFGVTHYVNGLVARRSDGSTDGRSAAPGTDRRSAAPGTGRRTVGPVTAGVPAAVAASAGFGVQFLAMAQVGADGGPWPVVVSRVASVMVIAAVLAPYRSPVTLPGRLAAVAGAGGAVGTVAILLCLAATRHRLTAVATVPSALHPAIPVLPALGFLHERLTRRQTTGPVCAAAAIALIALRRAPYRAAPPQGTGPDDPPFVVPRGPVGPLSRLGGPWGP